MKQAVATILAFLYLATSSGAVINAHYCMGKMYSVDFSDNNKCGKCGMKHEKGCCESKAKVLKAQDAHPLASSEVGFQLPYFVVPSSYNTYADASLIAAPVLATGNHSPPLLSGSLSVLYCVFRL